MKDEMLAKLQRELAATHNVTPGCGANAAAPNANSTRGSPPEGGRDDRVAIVGYSCILPGGENVNEAWEMLQAGIDVSTPRRPTRAQASHRTRQRVVS